MAQTGNVSGEDWQEEVYQKITFMKDMYFQELNEMYVKFAGKLQQHDSLPQQPRNAQLEKLKFFKHVLEHLITFLRSTKNDIQISHKDKLVSVERQIINILRSNLPRRPVSLQQLPQPAMATIQHSQPQSQISQLSHTLQHISLSSVPPVLNPQQNMMSTLQPASTLDPGQSNAHSLCNRHVSS